MSTRRATPRPAAETATTTTDRLLTTAEVASLIGRHPRTLENWRSHRARISYVTSSAGRFAGYRESDVQAYIESLTVVEVAR